MKLLRWGAAGASAYVIYKYTIGRRAQGERVFVSPEDDAEGELPPERESAASSQLGKLGNAGARLIGSFTRGRSR